MEKDMKVKRGVKMKEVILKGNEGRIEGRYKN